MAGLKNQDGITGDYNRLSRGAGDLGVLTELGVGIAAAKPDETLKMLAEGGLNLGFSRS